MKNAATELPPALDAESLWLDDPDCGRIHVYQDRAQTGRPLILIHSINAAPSAIEMRPLYDHFRRQRPVFAIELPGFGRSDRPDIHYSKTHFVAAIVHLLESLDWAEAVDIIALSLSAEFAARVALEHPECIRSLTLISPTGLGFRQPPVAIGRAIFGCSRIPLLGAGLYRALTSEKSIRHFLGMAFTGAPAEDMVQYALITTRQPGARYAPFHFLSFALFDDNAVDHLYKPLKTPALVLYDCDPNVNFERLDELLQHGHCWQAERISPSLGLPHWEHPELTTDHIERFYRSLEGH